MRKPGAKTPLGQYLIHRDISLSDFARSHRLSAQAVHRCMSGPDDFYTRVAA
jgi:hypothetical protein